MDDQYDPQHHVSHAEDERPKLSFWRKLGGGSLSISLIVHGIILAVGIVWVVSIIPPPPEKKVDFMPSGGGGGSPAASEVKNKKRSMSLNSNAPRMAAVGAESKFALPEPDTSSEMTSLGSLGGGGLSAGLGGNGSGGGRGDGTGKGFGSGMGPGMGAGTGAMNPFGMINPNANALVGVFYDLKQDSKRKPTNITNEEVRDTIKDFTNRGWNERTLANKYYQAPQKLYQTKVYIPVMAADGAPKAFNCEKEVQPSRWVVIYRGTVTPPKTGKYRFVGAGDDVLVVRFNNKHVFDHGFTSGTTGVYLASFIPVLKGSTENKDVERKLRGPYPMKLPVTFYPYDTTRNWNGAIGGLAVGPEFEANAGTSYPIEILISEIPGGLFCASLMIEEIGGNYQKVSNGSPILPLFRLDGASPPATSADNAPPYDPQGPVWKLVGKGQIDI